MRDVLLLNASYEYLNIVRWTRAMCLLTSGRAKMVCGWNDKIILHSAEEEHELPSVITLVTYVRVPHNVDRPAVNRRNIILRDRWTCMYCQKKFHRSNLTIDHVLPLSKGGQHVWTNVATACWKCNNKKDDKTLDNTNMNIMYRPFRPKSKASLILQRETTPIEWHPYLEHVFDDRRNEAINAKRTPFES